MAGAAAFLALSGARVPVVQAPMAGFAGVEMAIAAIAAGGVGSLPCALLTSDEIRTQASEVRARASGPLNLNFFCHLLGPAPDESDWRAALARFYAAEGVAPPTTPPVLRRPFDEALCEAVEAVRPEIVSFHFGLPADPLLQRVRATGARIFGNATSVAEARWLAERGCDAVIAQGYEAGGHAGWFLGEHRPVGLVALLPQIADAIDLPLIAAGGIADPRAVRAAFALGASAVQIGTALLAAPESRTIPPHRARLGTAGSADSVFTTLFSGRAARGLHNRLIDALGPVHPAAPPFPYASIALAPLRAAAEAEGRDDYTPLWAGQAAPLVRGGTTAALIEALGTAAMES